jgi:hypothetical protein
MEWRDIETAPQDGRRILVYSGHMQEVLIARWEKDYHGKYGWRSEVFSLYPSHWMAIPEPPKGE